jgi:enoyl-CoA hydratase/carnithine racemase
MTDATRLELANVIYETQAGVATITLNQPGRLNALSHGPGSMHADIATAMRLADEDPAVRCVVVTGAGRSFSSGGDMTAGSLPVDVPIDWYFFHEEMDLDNARIHQMHKPILGAINGLCYGGALIMAAHFDLLIAAEDARFGMIEARMGGSGVSMLPFLIGPQWSKFMMLTGEVITAHKAKEIGLVLEVFPASILLDRVYALARRIAAMPKEAVLLNKRAVDGALDAMGLSVNAALGRAISTVVDAMGPYASTPDGRRFMDILKNEGFAALKEARDGPHREPWLPAENQPH